MDLDKQLLEDMKAAMKAKDKIRLETIRGLRAQIKNAQIDKGAALDEDEYIQLLTNAAKKRKESIEQFRQVGREERAEEESRELEIIREYLPKQLTENEIAVLVDAVIAEVQATSAKDMGKVMGAVMPRLRGKADGKTVQQIVRNKLGDV